MISLVTFGKYRETLTFLYDPNKTSSVEQLRLNSDITDIEIAYNSTPMDQIVKIEVNFYIAGPLVSGKTYSHYFKPILWDNSSSPVKFTLESLPSIQIEQPLVDNFIIVTLRTDIVYAIDVITSIGNIETLVPINVVVDNINLTSKTGGVSLLANGAIFTNGFEVFTYSSSTTLNFTNCKMSKYIKIKTSSGNITLISDNMRYIQDCAWDLNTSIGNIDVIIYQSQELGANVKGIAYTSLGRVSILYRDNLDTVGARFAASARAISLTNSTGFEISLSIGSLIVYDSLDFVTTINSYNLALDSATGAVIIDGISVPLDRD